MGDRFDRQRLVAQIGEAGQRKLREARVAVVGAGGLGSPVMTYLACAGAGALRIIDPDTVELTNLNRQFAHTSADIGRQKALSAADFVRRTADDVEVESVVERLTADNAAELLSGCDIVVDCVDSIASRLDVCAATLKNNIPLVEGGINGFYGFVACVKRGSACLACMGFERDMPKTPAALGAVAGVVGSLQALEAIKILLDIEDVCYNRIIHFDGINTELEAVAVNRQEGCPLCGDYGDE